MGEKKKKCWVKRRERKTRSIRKADLVVCRNGGPPVTSGGIGVVGQRLATLGQGTLVPVGELIYNAHLGNTKGLLSSLRFNVFSLRDYSSFFSLVISSSLGHPSPCSFTFFHHVSWHAFLRFLRFSLWRCAV